MDYSEKWGKDVDEAVRLALEDLGLSEDQVMVTVLEEPTKGFLGIGSKLAKVRVERIQSEEPSAPEVDGNKAQSEKKVNRDLRKKNKPQSGGAGSGSRRDSRDGRDRDNSRRGGRGGSEHRSGGDRRERQQSSRNERSTGGKNNANETAGHEDFSFEDIGFEQRPSLSERPENLTEVADNVASVFLKEIIAKMNLDVNIKVFENENCIFIEIAGADSKTVIGKRGQTMDSLQYLTNLVANKDREVYWRVIIDVEGYRSRREKTLEGLAIRLARKVQKSGRSVKLEPMNPYERKVIHSTLQSLEGVVTRSEGEEPYRRVIIERDR
jgi:spoIIIJ-associated protein